uniref:HSF-type DNA-binding domain-containing protein n=1 Tax=Pygocentrus nattereri TaxID=42514 RepID=A0AAR2KE36_PYGNA
SLTHSPHSSIMTSSVTSQVSDMTNTMKRKAGEGIDDQTLPQTFPSKRTRTDGKEVNFSTLTFPQRLWHIWGTCIIDVELFLAEILSQQGELKIFETSVLKSFKRQLNLYGFMKIRSSEVKAKRNSGSKPMTLASTYPSQTPQSGLIEEATPSASKTSLDLGFSQDTSSDAPPMTSSVDSSLDSTLLSLLAKITDLAQTTITDLHLKAAQLQSTLAALIPSMSPSVLADLSSLVSRALVQPCPKCGHNPLCSEDSETAGH